MTSLNKVKDFWEKNPLWTGECQIEEGTLDFFQEHRKVYYDDCFAGSFDIHFFCHPLGNPDKTLRYWTLVVV